jgi:hypothetical protein
VKLGMIKTVNDMLKAAGQNAQEHGLEVFIIPAINKDERSFWNQRAKSFQERATVVWTVGYRDWSKKSSVHVQILGGFFPTQTFSS